jgi:23S rRNA (uracil1939-C5)-methyltransferase
MVDVVVGDRCGDLALDLYSGVGLFALALAQAFQRVIAVESSPVSVADLRHNLPQNATISSRNAEDFLENPGENNRLRPDLVVADPPRAGLGSVVCKQLSALSPSEIVYVSCDPATLARDLKQLLADSWRISALHLVDLFPQTFHIETITVLQH